MKTDKFKEKQQNYIVSTEISVFKKYKNNIIIKQDENFQHTQLLYHTCPIVIKRPLVAVMETPANNVRKPSLIYK